MRTAICWCKVARQLRTERPEVPPPLHAAVLGYSRGSMTDDVDNRLRQLCEIAKVEQDCEKIRTLVQEITRLLVEKLERQSPDRKAG